MTAPDDPTEARLRALFRQAGGEIHPTRPPPDPGGAGAARPRRASRPATLGLSIGLAVCLVAALAVGLGLHTFGGSDDVGPAATTAPAGVLLTVRSDGVVALLSPATGAVVRTLVGPSPVDADGRHLSRPDGVAAAGGMAYVAYLQPEPVIESIPFAGGVPRYVTDGMYPSANRAGTELAFVRLPPATNQETDPEVVVIRDLATGSERVVDQAAANGLLQTTSWSSNGTELVLSGLFIPGLLPDAVFAVQLLDLDQPLSSTNPRFVGTPKAISGPDVWMDGQFIGSGGYLAVLVPSRGTLCRPGSSRLVSVDLSSGRTGTVLSLPYSISDPAFDGRGHLVAFLRTLAPPSCHAATTTTTTTTTATTLTTMPLHGGSSSSSSSTGRVDLIRTPLVLEVWSNGTARKVASDVAAVVYVARRS